MKTRCSAVGVVYILLAACGPEAEQQIEVQPWMSGVWSAVLLDEYNLRFTDNDNADPAHFSFEPDSLFLGPLGIGAEERTWEPVSETEVRVYANDEEAEGELGQVLWYDLTPATGERDCDTIEIVGTLQRDGELHTFHRPDLYRGAVCLFPNPPCDDEDAEQVEPQCGGMHFDWCERPFPACGMDCFCQLDSPGTVAMTPPGQ